METQGNTTRVAVVGAAGVGKSALTVRLLTGRFLQHYDPTLEDEYETDLVVDGEERRITVLDTAGQDNEHLHDYSSSSNVLVVAFSLADLSSLQHAKQITALVSNRMTPIVLVGTKADLKSERQVSRDEALSVAINLRCPYLETSAASGFNVNNLYQLAVGLVLADLRKAQLARSLEMETKQQKTKPIKGILRRWRSMRQKKAHNSTTTPSVSFVTSR